MSRLLALVLLTTFVWLTHYDRWTLHSWQLPTDYSGDSLEVLARIRAAAEGDTTPLTSQVISRLGAPFGANWNAYPASDQPLIWTIGLLSRAIGFYPAVNLALLFASVSAAASFYGCARLLRWRWEWAFATAVLFAFTFQAFSRGLPHFTLAFSWTVPLALVSCALVASSRRLEFRNWGGPFCLGAAFVLGLSNPYNLFFFLQLLLWALLIQYVTRRRRENLLVGGLAMLLALLGLGLSELPFWLYSTDTAAVSPLVRNYGSTERYALKPLELFLPPDIHRFESLAFFGHRYLRWSEWRGEAFCPYLGLIGIGGLLFLGGETLVRVLRRRRVPGACLPAFWVICYASVGGVTNLVAFFSGVHLFRATNRFSIFLSAVVLMFLASRLTRLTQRWPAWSRLGFASLMVVVGLADQIPRGMSVQDQERIAASVAADREFSRRVEEALGREAMLFQYPVIVFPEAPTPHHLQDYEHFRPFLASDSLRISYGSLRGRARGRWQRELNQATATELVRRLERYGFGGLYFNRRSFEDGGSQLLADLAAEGRTAQILDASGEQVVVALRPAARRELPVARGLTPGKGWHLPPPGNILAMPRWSWSNSAALSYFNPYGHAIDATIKLKLSGAAPNDVEIFLNDEPTAGASIGVEPKEIVIGRVRLRPGANRVDIHASRDPIRASQGRNGLRSFALHQSEVSVVPDVLTAGR